MYTHGTLLFAGHCLGLQHARDSKTGAHHEVMSPYYNAETKYYNLTENDKERARSLYNPMAVEFS